MHYQAVTQLLHSEEKSRSLPGKLGSHLKETTPTFMHLSAQPFEDLIVERHRAKKWALCALFDTSMKLSTQIVLLVTLNF